MTLAKSFHLTLLVAAVVPYLLLSLQYAGATGVAVALAVVGFFATGRVPATLYLLRDPDVRNRIKGDRWFMIWLPVGVMIATFAAFILLAQNVGGSAPLAVYALMLGYTLWQTWHFAKQNIGVYSFSCIAAKRGPMSLNERIQTADHIVV